MVLVVNFLFHPVVYSPPPSRIWCVKRQEKWALGNFDVFFSIGNIQKIPLSGHKKKRKYSENIFSHVSITKKRHRGAKIGLRSFKFDEKGILFKKFKN